MSPPSSSSSLRHASSPDANADGKVGMEDVEVWDMEI